MSYIDPRQKLFAHMDTLTAIRNGLRPPPVNVELFLSHRCSHGCAWCHYAYTHTRGPLAGKVAKPLGAMASGDLMPFDLAYSILTQLKDAGVKSVTLSGGGEPTLHPEFERVVLTAVTKKIELGIYTHGGHINEERASIMKEAFTWVFVSLDECTEEAFKASKGVNRFNAVLDGIRNLVSAKGDATIGLGFLLHKDNFHEVRQMVTLARALGADYVQFRPTILYKQDAPGQLMEDTSWVDWAVGYLNSYRDDPFVIADVSRFRMYQNWNGQGYATCNWSALQTAISPNGMVWRCTNKTEHPDALLGDLTVDTFAYIWARSGGPCQVDSTCRVLCRGHIANLTLDELFKPMVHGNFV